MNRGLYTGTLGMLVQEASQDAIAHNLANVTTTSFKRIIPVFHSLPQISIHRLYDTPKEGFHDLIAAQTTALPLLEEHPQVGPLGTGVVVDEITTIFEGGPIRSTGNRLDLAIQGSGFFAIQTEEGEVYTRNGSFTLNKESQITTLEGSLVLGQKGPIKITAPEFAVTEDGLILENPKGDPAGWKSPQEVDQLKIVDFKNKGGLVRRGDSLFVATGLSGEAEPASDFRIHQGYLEGSNVNPVIEMVRMIEAMRAYEANQKIIQSHDQCLGRAINDVGTR
ncbi:TPA: flagellar basal-body rod protein FlgF [bacterium]|nr:flagellar basal-body rod protein FlgF [bacterium]